MRLVAVVAVAALMSACSGGADHASVPTTSRSIPSRPAVTVPVLQASATGYTVPNPLPRAAPGTLISARADADAAQTLGAGNASQMLYHSTDLAGHDIAVSALVLTPTGRDPAGGWFTVAWAHGTSGLADQCAPSLAPGLAHDPTAVAEVRALLARGWAVVASDYPGLGTPGVHSYLIGAADARAVVDGVTAMHALLGAQVSAPWVTVGHSEGGQSALFVAQVASTRAPRWPFLGTVALAPASTLEALIPLTEASPDPVEQAYLLYALVGLTTVDPTLDVPSLLTPAARVVLADATTGCIDDITNDLRHRHLTQLLVADDATKSRLNALLGRYDDPDRVRAPQPILVAQGLTDQDVPSPATDGMVARMCALGDRVQYRHFAGLDHAGVVPGSLSLVTQWINARRAHAVAVNTCTP
jgi:alpha-beta hydrolase superfamily lysophospholipase